MRTNRLRRGPEVTVLGMGTAQLGNLYRETTEAEVSGAVDAAFERGIAYLDTAPHYGLGLSERRLGARLAGRPRDTFTVSTKVGRVLDPSPETADRMDDEGFAVPAGSRRRFDLSRDGIRRSLESSLERLGLDHVDIAYLHDPDLAMAADADRHGLGAVIGALEALAELRDEGLVRAIGTGTNQSALPAELVGRADLDVVMIAGRYTLLDLAAERDLLPAALEQGVDVVAAGVYNSGLLSRDRVPADAHYDYQAAPAALVERANRIAEVCEEFGVTLPVAALQFPLRHPAVVSVVVGCRSRSHVEQSADRLATPVPDELWDALASRALIG
jgi:D-threo-aldose 1-dehydrogenase